MGIDGIGKGGKVPPGASGVGEATPAGGGAFSIGEKAATESASGSEALARVERGELSVDEYLDERVADAVAHLDGTLPAEQLDFVRSELRKQLAEDPVLTDLVRRTLGAAAPGGDGSGRAE